MSATHTAVAAVRRAISLVAELLPEPPSRDSTRPDIDGRRRSDLDPDDLRRVHRAGKKGKGGYR
jgi:hypothetical protein